MSREIKYKDIVPNSIVNRYKEERLAQPEQTEQKPLSDEAIADLWWNNYVGTADSVRNFARGIEKAHGIGGGE